MTAAAYVLAIDQGTTSSRAIVFDAEARPAAGLAVDNDPEATACTQENLERNQVASVRVTTGTLADAPGTYDLVLANIQADVLLAIADDMAARLTDGSGLILSGLRPCVPELVNSVGIRLALIPAGTFWMGNLEQEGGGDPGEARHQVRRVRPTQATCPPRASATSPLIGLGRAVVASGIPSERGTETSLLALLHKLLPEIFDVRIVGYFARGEVDRDQRQQQQEEHARDQLEKNLFQVCLMLLNEVGDATFLLKLALVDNRHAVANSLDFAQFV